MSEKSSSQLDTLETSGVSQPPSTYRKFCKSHCKEELDASRALYSEFLYVPDSPYPASEDYKVKSRLIAFDECRTSAWFARNKSTGKVKVMSSSCKLRWCPMCASTRKWFMTQQVSEWFETTKKPKFMTLTLAHTTSPLDRQIIHLYKCFQKFRKLNLLKKHVTGGVWFFQIKKSKTDELWHPHLHCVLDAEYIDKFALSTAWATITVTSKIVDIRKVEDPNKMAEYVARYAARPSLLASLDQSERLELASALHGRRLVGTWGSARSISLRPSKPPDADDWVSVGDWWTVINFINVDFRANEIWKSFVMNTALPEDCNLLELQNKINGVHEVTPWTVDEHYQMMLDFY